MKRNGFVLVLALMLRSVGGMGQNNPVTDFSPIIPHDRLPNAKAEGAGENLIYDVDLYHGTANVRIPIFDYKLDGMDLGVSLSYDCRGIKVDQIASTAGLGWTLNAGSIIERNLAGVEDEYALEPLSAWTPPFNPETTKWWKVNPIAGTWVRNQYMSRPHDSEKDILQVNLAGRSLEAIPTFNVMSDTWKMLVTSPKSELRFQIRYATSSNWQGSINTPPSEIIDGQPRVGIKVNDSINYFRFNIRDEKGHEFEFDRGDYQYKMHSYPYKGEVSASPKFA